MTRVYLDHNATSPMRPEAFDAVRKVLQSGWGNPSSVHSEGRAARAVIDDARVRLAHAIGAAASSEIVFVASATEANHLALAGITSSGQQQWTVMTTPVEHPSVIETARRMELAGRFEVVLLEVDRSGRVVDASLEAALEAASGGPVLVSVIAGNNETGVLQRVASLARLVHRYDALLHLDATQCVGRVPFRVSSPAKDSSTPVWPADLLTFSSHKLGGPRGAGALYVRRGLSLEPVLSGGHQERDRRAGTEDTAAIAGFVSAAEAAIAALPQEQLRLAALAATLRDGIASDIDSVTVVGGDEPRLPNTVAVAFEGCSGEELLAALDLDGISVSSGSACSSGSLAASPVLLAMGFDEDVARAVVRFSLGWTTAREDIALVLRRLPDIVGRCRELAACDF